MLLPGISAMPLTAPEWRARFEKANELRPTAHSGGKILAKIKKSNGVIGFRWFCGGCGYSRDEVSRKALSDREMKNAPLAFSSDPRVHEEWYDDLLKNPNKPCRSFHEERRSAWRAVYEEYLLSEAWARKRRAALDRDHHKCTRCGSTAEQVHHKTYDQIGDEDLDDLSSICKKCHNALHGVS